MKKLVALSTILCLYSAAQAQCETDYIVNLRTFGEGVKVELRFGSPGNSKVVASRYSSGGQVAFRQLCSGNYFLAIGNEESVSVTPVRFFEDQAEYTSTITFQRGSGNVAKRPRGSL
jgi:hypothetical protein